MPHKGYKQTAEVIRKKSEALKGEGNPFFGKKHSKETKRKISLKKKGCIGWNKGKHLSEEIKQKIRAKAIGRVVSEETKQKLSGRTPWNKNSFEINCDNCGEPYTIAPSRFNSAKSHCCCTKCSGEWTTKNGTRKGKNSPRYNSVLVKCSSCGEEIEVNNYRVKINKDFYCKNCYGKSKVLVNCRLCGKEIERTPYKLKISKAFYCIDCKCNKSKGTHPSEETIQNMRLRSAGQNNPNYGKHHSEETKLKISLKAMGRPSGVKGRKFPERSGANSASWKGGVTPEYRLARTCIEYLDWRTSVFERDNYTCQLCGDSKGANLTAHHIKGFTLYPELRFDINNGITYCKPCHQQKIHSKKKLQLVNNMGGSCQYQLSPT